MISHLPTPNPDELLYSLCARFSYRVRYPNAKSVIQELFGSTTGRAIVDLPNRLGYLAANLPRGTLLTVSNLIDKHTPFPFFSAFIAPERVKQIRKDMQASSGPASHMRSGIMGSNIPKPSYMRFCPACKQGDKNRLGEVYWHRVHQLPGIEVCPSHQIFLENSRAILREGRQHLLFIPAAKAIESVPIRHINPSSRNHQKVFRIAQDAMWLLNHPIMDTDLKTLYNRYLSLLIDKGFAGYTGSLHVVKLLDEFRRFYPPGLLKHLHCEFSGSDHLKSNWLLQLVRPPKHAQHPLYHLLLMQFLGCTVEEFFQLPSELSFFGEGPWPCLNPAADHYMKPVVREFRSGKRLRDNKPIGIFSCECGFAFARTGPDSTPEDRFRIGRMISFEPVWEAKLKELWNDSSLSMSEISRRLGVDPLTARRHATRLKLSFSRSGRSSTSLNPATQLKGRHTSTAWEKKRRTYRAKWLSVMKRNRKVTLKALRQKFPRVYTWLRQNDFEWLKDHRPESQRHIQSTSSVDWKRRDAKYAVAVRVAASSIKDAPGRPVQVTKTAIGRTIGAITLLQRKLYKMPLTAQILAGVVETREQYAVRRVWWAADLYRQEDVLPREWQLVMRANVYSLREVSAVKCAVEGTMSMLISKLSQSTARRAAS
jgi:Tn7-like transposition protein D/TniQ